MPVNEEFHVAVEPLTVPIMIIASHKRGGRTFLLKDTRVTVIAPSAVICAGAGRNIALDAAARPSVVESETPREIGA